MRKGAKDVMMVSITTYYTKKSRKIIAYPVSIIRGLQALQANAQTCHPRATTKTWTAIAENTREDQNRRKGRWIRRVFELDEYFYLPSIATEGESKIRIMEE